MKKKRIAVVAPDLSILTGVSVVARFVFDVIFASDNYEAELISVATSSRDENSLRLLKPASWTNGIRVSTNQFQNLSYRHVGANLTEIEYFRYRPRRSLDAVLNDFDLVQVVAGTPPWTLVAANFRGPLALQVATLTAVERETILKRTPQPRRAWMQMMTGINQALERRAFERADAVFVENFWLKEKLDRRIPEKVVFAPPGVDTDFFKPGKYAANGYLLSVGRFADPRKNVRMLFEAYKNLSEIYPAAPKLILAGQNAPVPADLEFARDLGIREKIEIETDVSAERLAGLYRGASVFVLSSNEEGFGLVIAEAMGAGLPVVATRCGGPEVLVKEGETGYLVSIGDAENFSLRIAALLGNGEERERFGSRAREIAVNNFSYPAAGKIYLETYEKLLNK